MAWQVYAGVLLVLGAAHVLHAQDAADDFMYHGSNPVIELAECRGERVGHLPGRHHVFDYGRTLQEICGGYLWAEAWNNPSPMLYHHYYEDWNITSTHDTIAAAAGATLQGRGATSPMEVTLFWHAMTQDGDTYSVQYPEATIANDGQGMPRSQDSIQVESIPAGEYTTLNAIRNLTIVGNGNNCEYGEVLVAARPSGSNDEYTVYDRIRTRPGTNCMPEGNVTLHCPPSAVFTGHIPVTPTNNPGEYEATALNMFSECRLMYTGTDHLEPFLDTMPSTVVTFARPRPRRMYDYNEHHDGWYTGDWYEHWEPDHDGYWRTGEHGEYWIPDHDGYWRTGEHGEYWTTGQYHGYDSDGTYPSGSSGAGRGYPSGGSGADTYPRYPSGRSKRYAPDYYDTDHDYMYDTENCRYKEMRMNDVHATRDHGVWSWEGGISPNGRELPAQEIRWVFNADRPAVCGNATVFVVYDMFGFSQPRSCQDFVEIEVFFDCSEDMELSSVQVIPDVTQSGTEAYVHVYNRRNSTHENRTVLHVSHGYHGIAEFEPIHPRNMDRDVSMIKKGQVYVEEVQEMVTISEKALYLEQLIMRERLDISDQCLAAMEAMGALEEQGMLTPTAVAAALQTARAACDDPMDVVLDFMEQHQYAIHQSEEERMDDRPDGEMETERNLFQGFVDEALQGQRTCRRENQRRDGDVFAALEHLSPRARLFNRITRGFDSEDFDCHESTADDITDESMAYLKLRDLVKRDERLRMILNAAVHGNDGKEHGGGGSEMRHTMEYLRIPETQADMLGYLQHCPKPDQMMPRVGKTVFYSVENGFVQSTMFNPFMPSTSTTPFCKGSIAKVTCPQCAAHHGWSPYGNGRNSYYGSGGYNWGRSGEYYPGGGYYPTQRPPWRS